MSTAASKTTVELSPEDSQYAEQQVETGHFRDVTEVAREAFRLLRNRDHRLQQVREELAGIFTEMEDGTYVEPTDEEFARIVRERAAQHTAE